MAHQISIPLCSTTAPLFIAELNLLVYCVYFVSEATSKSATIFYVETEKLKNMNNLKYKLVFWFPVLHH